LACIIGLVGGAMQCGAPSFPVFCAGRIVGGVASGIVISLCPVYAAEISPPAVRGHVGGLFSFNINFSYMLTEWIGLGFYFIKSDVAWRLLLGLQLVPPILMLIGSIWMPFSPRWLAYKGRYDECLEVLQRIHQGPDQDDDFYLREYHQIRAQIELDKEEKLGMKAILQRPSYRKRFMLVCLFSVCCQLTGIIPLQNYQVILYGKLGLDNVMALIITGVWGVNATISALYAAFCFDKVGRRATIVSLSITIPSPTNITITVHCLFLHSRGWSFDCNDVGTLRSHRFSSSRPWGYCRYVPS
jgi:MFS family permease